MAELIPRRVLFGNPERISPRISPDGTRMAWIAPDRGVLNVWVAPVGHIDEAAVVTDDRDRGIRDFFWAYDDRHLLYVQDRGGDENWRLYGVDLDENTTRDLTPFDKVQAQVIEVDKKFPDQLLVGLNKDNPQLHDVYRLELSTGELTKVADNPGFAGWVVDADFAVRGAVLPKPDGGTQLVTRATADDEWRPLLDVGPDDALTTAPIAFSLDGRRLLAISSVGFNAGRLVWLDLATGPDDVTAEVVTEDPHADVAGVRIHPDSRLVQLVAFQKDRTELVVTDPSIQADIDALQALSHGDLTLQNRDNADRTWLVGFVVDDGPVPYYAWDRDTHQATFLFEHQPELSKYTLARMEPFEYQSRDGLTIHGYLTFPADEPREGLPTVLNVHGGPWARDSWGYNPEAQWFANRGYLCVQVNYRGSTGYGKDFVNAGDKA